MLKKILYPSAIYFTGAILSAVLGFFFKSYVVKNLEFSFLGIYSLGMSIVSIIVVFTTLGYGDGLIFFIPKYLSKKNYSRLHKYLQTTFLVNVITITIFSVIILSYPNFILNQLFRAEELEPYLFYFILLLIINSFVSIFIQIINGFQKIHKSVFIEKFISNPFRILLCVVLINMNFDFYGFLIAEILASFLAFILLAKNVINQFKTINIPHLYTKSILNTSSVEKSYSNSMLFKNIFNQLTVHLGIIIFAIYADLEQLGIYALIISITSFIPLFLISVNTVFRPIISQLYAQGKITEINKYFKIISRYTFIFSLPLIVCLFLSKGIILNYFRINNYAAEIVFILFIFSEFIKCAKGPVYICLQMMGHDKEIRNIGLLNLCAKTTLFFILIPKYGLIGIGIAEIFSVTFSIIISSIILYNKRSIHIFHKKYLTHIVISIVAFILINIIMINFNDIDSIYKITWMNFIVVIFTVLPNLLLIDREEMKAIKSIFISKETM